MLHQKDNAELRAEQINICTKIQSGELTPELGAQELSRVERKSRTNHRNLQKPFFHLSYNGAVTLAGGITKRGITLTGDQWLKVRDCLLTDTLPTFLDAQGDEIQNRMNQARQSNNRGPRVNRVQYVNENSN
jgi:hypothetical protein